jgi:hypothetical protein
MNKDTGGPAFPGLHPSAECRYSEEGMTLRDYFAAKAMQGMLAADTNQSNRQLGETSYLVADAMMEARKQ